MPTMLDDHIFSPSLRYEQHALIAQMPSCDDPIRIEGVLGAALLCALLVDTDEGAKRNINIDSENEQNAWIKQYEREVRRNDWGLLDTEIKLLSDAFIQLAPEQQALTTICPNTRLLDLAIRLMAKYMKFLVIESYGEHIWLGMPWETPFAQWLFNAAYFETKRQQLLNINWMNPAEVVTFTEAPNNTDSPTFIFYGEAANDIMQRYFTWAWSTFQTELQQRPGVKRNSNAQKRFVLNQETDCSFLESDIRALSNDNQAFWQQWMNDWQTFITRQLKPEKEIRFWNKGVTEDMQEKLIAYLKLQEKEPMRYKCLTAAIYSLRQLGYIRRACTTKDITRWISDKLAQDYTSKSTAFQFNRAWKEHGRYSEAIRDEVAHLRSLGVPPLLTLTEDNLETDE